MLIAASSVLRVLTPSMCFLCYVICSIPRPSHTLRRVSGALHGFCRAHAMTVLSVHPNCSRSPASCCPIGYLELTVAVLSCSTMRIPLAALAVRDYKVPLHSLPFVGARFGTRAAAEQYTANSGLNPSRRGAAADQPVGDVRRHCDRLQLRGVHQCMHDRAGRVLRGAPAAPRARHCPRSGARVPLRAQSALYSAMHRHGAPLTA